jgi:hypothetical protein
MAKLIRKTVGGVTFGCYSERGIVGYYMMRVMPADPASFLRQVVDGAGGRPFGSVGHAEIAHLVVFSELGFGSKFGFGNPDGALYFELSGTPHMIFYEAKFNETYRRSCKGHSYNSTIQGQLELKWRVVTLFKQGSVQRSKRVDCIEETDEFSRYYSEKDEFYVQNAEDEDLSLGDRRHLALKDGVKTVFSEYVSRCDPDRIYFLTSTSDPDNPFIDPTLPASLRPECCGKRWDEVRHRFCWVSNTVIEGCPAV